MHILLIAVTALVLLAALLLAARALDHRGFVHEALSLRARAGAQPEDAVITEADLAALPAPVRRYLQAAGVVAGTRRLSFAHLTHGGTFRPSPKNPRWFPIEGEYYLTTRKPSFLWRGVIRMAPLLAVSGRDRYFEGRGQMLIQALGLFPLGPSESPSIDESSFGRLLTELTLIPTALAPTAALRWEPVDERSAKAVLTDSGREASCLFEFDAEGWLHRVELERVYESERGAERLRWIGVIEGSVEVDGFRVPLEVEGTWKLPTGDFPYVRFAFTGGHFE